MMREILFRGKHTEDDEWWYGDLFHTRKRVFIRRPSKLDPNDPPTVYEHFSVNPETVGQYTGLTDKNGKKIFEGDIVEGADFTVEDGGYGVVSFDEGAFEVSGNNIVGTFHENYFGKEFEVIGNIHDNPELLEGGAE